MCPKKTAPLGTGDFRKEKIVSRAAILMSQTGFESFTFKKLADRCGMKPSALHYHFKNKSDLFEKIIEKVVTDGREIIEKKLTPLQEKDYGISEIKIWIDSHFEWLDKAPYRQSLLMIFYAQSLRNPKLKVLHSHISQIGLARVRDILLRARSTHLFPNFNVDSKAVEIHCLLTSQLFYYCLSQSSQAPFLYNKEQCFKLANMILDGK